MIYKIRQFILEQPRENIAGMLIIIGTAITSPFYGGWDYLVAFRGETLSGTYFYTFNPLPAYWLFYLFAVLPPLAGYMVWNLVNALGFIYALQHWKANILAFSITIACLWNFFGGQFEGLLVAAIVISLTANPWLAGFGLYLLTFKPQVGLIIILFALFQRRDWRMLVVPGFIYLLSFLVYGWWVPGWLEHLRYGYENNIFGNTNISFYPIGIIFLLLLLRYRNSIKIWILSASLAVPYYPVYSLAGFFSIDPPPWWFSALVWIFYMIPDSFPNLAYILKFAYLIPMSLLVAQIWKVEKAKNSLSKQTEVIPSEHL